MSDPSESLRRVLLVLISAGLSFGAAEALLRLSPLAASQRLAVISQAFQASTKTHPGWGWSFAPDVSTDWDYTGRESRSIVIRFETIPIPGNPEYGMRDDGSYLRAARRVIVLGDSFSFGATVELSHVWAKRIEARHPGVAFVNLAIGGGLVKAVREYRDVRDHIAHDVVTYQLYVGNEFLDNDQYPHSFEPTADNLHVFYRQYGRFSDRSVLIFGANAALRRLIRGSARGMYPPREDEVWLEGIGNLSPTWAMPAFDRHDGHEADGHGVTETERHLALLDHLARERGKQLLVLLFPSKEQVYFDLLPDEARPDVDPLEPNRLVLEMCRRHGVACVDLFDELRRRRNGRLFWDYDPHLTPLGQALAAELVEGALRSRNLLNGS